MISHVRAHEQIIVSTGVVLHKDKNKYTYYNMCINTYMKTLHIYKLYDSGLKSHDL